MKISKPYWTLDLPHFRMEGETRIRLSDGERRQMYLNLHPRHKAAYSKRYIDEDSGMRAAEKLSAAIGLRVMCHETHSIIF